MREKLYSEIPQPVPVSHTPNTEANEGIDHQKCIFYLVSHLIHIHVFLLQLSDFLRESDSFSLLDGRKACLPVVIKNVCY